MSFVWPSSSQNPRYSICHQPTGYFAWNVNIIPQVMFTWQNIQQLNSTNGRSILLSPICLIFWYKNKLWICDLSSKVNRANTWQSRNQFRTDIEQSSLYELRKIVVSLFHSVCLSIGSGAQCDHYLWCHLSVTSCLGPLGHDPDPPSTHTGTPEYRDSDTHVGTHHTGASPPGHSTPMNIGIS